MERYIYPFDPKKFIANKAVETFSRNLKFCIFLSIYLVSLVGVIVCSSVMSKWSTQPVLVAFLSVFLLLFAIFGLVSIAFAILIALGLTDIDKTLREYECKDFDNLRIYLSSCRNFAVVCSALFFLLPPLAIIFGFILFRKIKNVKDFGEFLWQEADTY